MTFHLKDAESGAPVPFRTDPDPDGSTNNLEAIVVARAGDVANDIHSGRKTPTTVGTPEPLQSSTPCRWVSVTARKTNVSQVNTGGPEVSAVAGSSTGEPLDPGESVTYPVKDVSKVWVDIRTAGDGVSFTWGM
jgi:hypothetical protein